MLQKAREPSIAPEIIAANHNRLKTLLTEIGVTGDITVETDLIETGYLDSLAMVSLILEIERCFGVVFDYDNLEIENFKSISAMSNLISNEKAVN